LGTEGEILFFIGNAGNCKKSPALLYRILAQPQGKCFYNVNTPLAVPSIFPFAFFIYWCYTFEKDGDAFCSL